MKERPILFSAPMVRALMDGTKTQTRRVMKPQPRDDQIMPKDWDGLGWSALDVSGRDHDFSCPYGKPGDRLWCREAWTWRGGMSSAASDPRGPVFKELYVTYRADEARHTVCPSGYVETPQQPPQSEGEVYSLRDAPEDFIYDGENTYTDRLTRWWRRTIPGIHMFRWASRITLEITDVRVERLQAISEEDAKAEGCEPCLQTMIAGHQRATEPGFEYRIGYARLWDQINGTGSWAANPFIWCVSFRMVKP